MDEYTKELGKLALAENANLRKKLRAAEQIIEDLRKRVPEHIAKRRQRGSRDEQGSGGSQ